MDNEYLKRIYGLLESGATLGTGAVSGLVGLPYGLYKGVTSGAYGTPEAPRIAAREAQQFMERNTYQPRTAEGQENLRQIAGLLEASKLPPVMPEASLLAAIPKQAYAAQAERAGIAAEKAIAPIVTRTMERGGLPAQLLEDLSQGSRRQIFIGEKAKAWNKPAAELAKQLENQGLSQKEIWQQTGTARGADGKWRQEISDVEALLTNKQKNIDGKLHESLQHPSLYENYPALQYYDTEIQSEIALPEHLKKALIGKGRGSFTEKDFVTDEPKITAQAFSNEDKGALLHEIQHAVQSREGFARGGSPEAEFLSRGNITGDVLSPEAQLIYENKGVSKDQAAMEAYRRLAGEAEARLTADRALLTPEQRLQYFPFEERSFPNPYIEKTTDFNAYGLDVNPKDLIVRKGGLLGQSKAAEATDLLSYRGSHTAPGPDFGAPLHDLTGGGQMYPADVYSPKAAQYYGTGYPKADKEAFALANKVRGNPDAEVTMYRAVPKNESIKDINTGDWVTLSKEYAKNHGESVLDNDYKILSKKVKAKDLWTNADSIHEFGYWPE